MNCVSSSVNDPSAGSPTEHFFSSKQKKLFPLGICAEQQQQQQQQLPLKLSGQDISFVGRPLQSTCFQGPGLDFRLSIH